MEQVRHVSRDKQPALERARSQEKRATYATALIVTLIVIVVGRAVQVASAEPAVDRQRLITTILTIVQVIVTLATLVLVRNQVSVAVHQMEQLEETGSRSQRPVPARRFTRARAR
jgi:uncharacterized membrane protein YkgB